jgi:succinoglycan biosynthesis protein ExoA
MRPAIGLIPRRHDRRPYAQTSTVTEAPSPRNATAQAVDCSVLIPVFNEERYIEHSVAAMREQRFDGQLEFLFADGGSTDRTREILQNLSLEDPRIRVFDNPNRSVSSGLNVALRHARGRWAIRMDAHTEYRDDYVALGVERLARGGTRWVSGPQVPKGVGAVSRAVALALASRLGRGGSRKWGEQRAKGDEEWELDAGVFDGVWERSTLLEYGGWDERWPRNSDSEMAGRFLARGERLICLSAMAAEYVPRDSLAGLWRQYLAYGEYRTKTAARHPQTLRASHLLAPAIVLDAGLAIVAPGRTRTAARAGLGLYAAVLAYAGVRALPRAEQSTDALIVPGALAIMHFAHGLGMLVGAVRHGPPLAALASVAGVDGLAESAAPEPEPLFAPSLG